MELAFEKLPHSWVNRLSFLLRKDLQARFLARGENIAAEEWAVLLLLWRSNGQTPGELAAQTVRDRTTMTRLLDGMVRKKLVMRATDRKDRRKSRILLTSQGLEKKNILIPIAQEMIGLSLQGVSAEDLQTSVKVMAQMMENLQSDQSTSTGDLK